MRTIPIAVVVTIPLILVLTNHAAAQLKQPSEFNALPSQVKSAVQASSLDECEWKRIERIPLGYRLSGVDDYKSVTAIISPSGEIYEVRVESRGGKLPESVAATLQAEEPFSEALKVVSVGRNARTAVYYELSGLHISMRNVPPEKRNIATRETLAKPGRETVCITADGLVLTDAARNAVIRKKEQLPAEVNQAAEKAAPGVKWSFFASKFSPVEDTPWGHILLGRDSQDRRVQVIYDYDNDMIREVGVAMKKLDDVPQNVLAALRDLKPDFKPLRVDSLGPDVNSVACYEFSGKPEDKKPCVTADGVLVPDEFKGAVFLRPETIPAELRQAAERLAAGVKWNYTSAVFDEGKPSIYILIGRNSQGRRVLINHVVANRLTGSRTVVPESDVPATVREALKARLPDFRPRFIQAMAMDKVKDTGYQFDGEDAARKTMSVIVESNGKVIPLKTE